MGQWAEKFRTDRGLVFTEAVWHRHLRMVKDNYLSIYSKYLPVGSRLLDCGCGLGSTAISLSKLGYNVVGIDNDREVVKAAIENAEKYGEKGKIEIKFGDIEKLEDYFTPDSFDACIHGGVLEHYSEKGVQGLITKQLRISPLVVCTFPTRSERTLRFFQVRKDDKGKEICYLDRIHRNLWDDQYWIGDVLSQFNILEYRQTTGFTVDGLDGLVVVISR